jgi:hypothetical protein
MCTSFDQLNSSYATACECHFPRETWLSVTSFQVHHCAAELYVPAFSPPSNDRRVAVLFITVAEAASKSTLLMLKLRLVSQAGLQRRQWPRGRSVAVSRALSGCRCGNRHVTAAQCRRMDLCLLVRSIARSATDVSFWL